MALAVRFERFEGLDWVSKSNPTVLRINTRFYSLNPNFRTRSEPRVPLAAKDPLILVRSLSSLSSLRHAATPATSSAFTWAASEAWELIGTPRPFHQDMHREDARSRHRTVPPSQWPCFWPFLQPKCRREVTFRCFLLQKVGVTCLLEGLGFVFTR
jgi:hypothetical protein